MRKELKGIYVLTFFFIYIEDEWGILHPNMTMVDLPQIMTMIVGIDAAQENANLFYRMVRQLFEIQIVIKKRGLLITFFFLFYYRSSFSEQTVIFGYLEDTSNRIGRTHWYDG